MSARKNELGTGKRVSMLFMYIAYCADLEQNSRGMPCFKTLYLLAIWRRIGGRQVDTRVTGVEKEVTKHNQL